MNAFARAVWTVVKIGFALALLPTLLFFAWELVPALLATPSGAWAK